MDQMTIRKALDLASTGSYLIPEVVDNAIRDYATKEPVLANIVTRVPWATNTYFIRRRDALPTSTWSADGAALPSATQSTYAKVSKSVAYLYTRGEVSGPMQSAAGSLYNALSLEVEAHSRSLIEQLSTDIATATGGSDDIQGILHQIDTSDTMNWGSTGTGVVGGAAGVLSLALIDQAIDAGRGEADLIVTSRAVRRKINSLLQAQQQFVDKTEVAAGFRVLSYDGLPIVTDLHWETNTDILFLRRADAKLLVHQDFTFEELAKTKDSVDFMIKGYFGFALEGRPVHLNDFTI
jgi:HK97 family phage major capsid protein